MSEAELSPIERLYLPEYDTPAAPAPLQRYLVLALQRSGSKYLCNRLCSVRERFGMPLEYLNRRAVQMITPRVLPAQTAASAFTMGNYLDAVERLRTTPDGWFGLKAQPDQLMRAAGMSAPAIAALLGRFDRVVMLTRRDRIGQAVSAAVAETTRQWFDDGTDPDLPPGKMPHLLWLTARKLSRFIEEARLMQELRARISRPLLSIDFEEISQDGQAVFERLTQFISGEPPGHASGADAPDARIPVPQKPPGQLEARLREQFLRYIGGKPVLPAPK